MPTAPMNRYPVATCRGLLDGRHPWMGSEAGARRGSIHVDGCGTFQKTRSASAYLAVLVVDEDVAGAIVLQVGDLQPMRVADLGRLESGVQVFHLHGGLWLLGLGTGPLSGRTTGPGTHSP